MSKVEFDIAEYYTAEANCREIQGQHQMGMDLHTGA